jgi:lipid II:glycine glycyltransferase (peptidoglycan interpeptide bridge formation enzyme)
VVRPPTAWAPWRRKRGGIRRRCGMTGQDVPATHVADRPTPDWNALAVERPGGHVYQAVEWAEHRRRSGWRPLYVSTGDQRVLALTRPWPLIGGSSAYIPRGPAPVAGGGPTGAALWAAIRALAGHGVDVVAADPEVPADDAAFADWLRRARLHSIEEIQPSRHRISLPLEPGVDEAAVFSGIAKSTRQRIRKAEGAEGVVVVRHDARLPGGADTDPGDGFVRPAEPADVALDRFYELLEETGERRAFSFGPRADFVRWWTVALGAGLLVYLESRDASSTGSPLAGLVLYRHGGRLSTVHSGDHADSRRTHPGALHLLRWRAIQLAIREGCSEMDLGGVDVQGARRQPQESDPTYGLYQHKISFGGRWLELAGAHERVIRPNRYRAGRLTARLARLVTR